VAIKNQEISYLAFLQEVKTLIREGHQKAAFSLNSTLVKTYWNLGQRIAQKQSLFEGRNNYVEQLAKDLRAEFPEMKGFSRSNLFYVRKFYQFYSSSSVQQVVGLNEIQPDFISVRQPVELEENDSVQQGVRLNNMLASVPWGHNVVIINKLKDAKEVLFYLQQTIENNWSRSILVLQIEQDLYRRQGKATTNFQKIIW
jgi:predicted nuclease of restriction endonuclease-like (RecB) superfamily